jgi:ATP dependent DNA ligase domain
MQNGRSHSIDGRASPSCLYLLPITPAAVRPPKGDGWLHEPKWDGFRFQAVKDGSDVRLNSKSGAEYTERLPSMVAAFANLPARTAILDGELCLIDARSKHSGGHATYRMDFPRSLRHVEVSGTLGHHGLPRNSGSSEGRWVLRLRG